MRQRFKVDARKVRDLHQLASQPEAQDCRAGCAVSATPGAAAKAALSVGFENLTCAAFDDAI